MVGSHFKKNPNFHYLVSWYQYLKQQEEEVLHEVKYKVREAWMVMDLIDQVNKIDKFNVSTFLIADAAHFEGSPTFTTSWVQVGIHQYRAEVCLYGGIEYGYD